MQHLQVEVLTPEEQAVRHAKIMAENEQRDRERTAAENRKSGHAKPEPGDRLYVTTMRGIPRRGRAGIRFVTEARTQLLVVADLANPGPLPPDVVPVDVAGAESILRDDALNVSTRPAVDVDAADLRSQLADRDAELARVKEEIAKLQREARQAAPADPNGGPARLRAARNVPASKDEFGGKD